MRRLFFLIVVILLYSFCLQRKPVTIYLAGDSTMSFFELTRSPLTGWGTPFSTFFDSSVRIINKARGGRSSRTFISENRWQQIVDSLKKGDYVFIQFGHNDEAREGPMRDRYTSIPDYRKNLVRFILETRKKKAYPVLVTPVTRLVFDSAGEVPETHPGYYEACIEIAQQYKTPLIDLDKKSRELAKEMGPQAAKLMFLYLKPGENPHYLEGIEDNTHFTEYGARKLAELVLSGVRELLPNLQQRLFVPNDEE